MATVAMHNWSSRSAIDNLNREGRNTLLDGSFRNEIRERPFQTTVKICAGVMATISGARRYRARLRSRARLAGPRGKVN